MSTHEPLVRYVALHGECNHTAAVSSAARTPTCARLTPARGRSSQGGSGVSEAAPEHRGSNVHQPRGLARISGS